MTGLFIYDTDAHTNGFLFVFSLLTLSQFIPHVLLIIIILFHKRTRLIVCSYYRLFHFFRLTPKLQISWSYNCSIIYPSHLLLIFMIGVFLSFQVTVIRYMTLNILFICGAPYLRLIQELRIGELFSLGVFYATLHLLCSILVLCLIGRSDRFPDWWWWFSYCLFTSGVKWFQSIWFPRGCHIY